MSTLERNPYSPPVAPVADGAAVSPSRWRARIHIGIASVILLTYAAYFVNMARSLGTWGWLLNAGLLLPTALLLMFRRRWGRYLVYFQGAIYVGVWLVLTSMTILDVDGANRPMSQRLLSLVPGTVTILVPWLYCLHVGRRYAR